MRRSRQQGTAPERESSEQRDERARMAAETDRVQRMEEAERIARHNQEWEHAMLSIGRQVGIAVGELMQQRQELMRWGQE